LFEPAIAHAEYGFQIDRVLAGRISGEADIIRRYPETARILLKPNGSPYAQGELLLQPDLAMTLTSIANEGIEWFYRGTFAKTVGEWMGQNGGILSADDFAAYQCKYREPIRSLYRGYDVIGHAPAKFRRCPYCANSEHFAGLSNFLNFGKPIVIKPIICCWKPCNSLLQIELIGSAILIL
jgi:gamma-glutamyltranspeptidase